MGDSPKHKPVPAKLPKDPAGDFLQQWHFPKEGRTDPLNGDRKIIDRMRRLWGVDDAPSGPGFQVPGYEVSSTWLEKLFDAVETSRENSARGKASSHDSRLNGSGWHEKLNWAANRS